jgi:hypothetical protein
MDEKLHTVTAWVLWYLCIGKAFLLRCVNPTAIPLVRLINRNHISLKLYRTGCLNLASWLYMH